MSEDAVLECASVKFLEQVKRQSLAKNCVFIEIPPGASNIHREFPSGVVKGLDIKYIQQEGERTCLITSVSSMLLYVNGQKDANQLFNWRNKIQEYDDVWDRLHCYLLKIDSTLKLEKNHDIL